MKNYKKPIIKTCGTGTPSIVVVGCLHGEEPVGKQVIEEIHKLEIKNGKLKTIIAHPLALDKKKRFIEKDLNRSFPGNSGSSILEEKLAYIILGEISQNDYVIDIHSTSTHMEDVVIVTHLDKKIRKIINHMQPKTVVIMGQEVGSGGLVNYCSGISLEYSRHNSENIFERSFRDVKTIMSKLGLIIEKLVPQRRRTSFFYVFGSEPKPKNFKMDTNISNFKKVKRGDILGTIRNKKIFAKEDFYPVLFGQNSYKEIMGFKAKKKRFMVSEKL